MNVFVSWSGPTSHRVAIVLRDWLRSALQAVEPYVSSENVDKGARWNTEISQELESSNFGILCVTPENIGSPWLNFEAGALSKALDRARVTPFLFRVERTAITEPLRQFQSTLPEKDDVRKLVKSLNSALGDQALDEGRVDEIFDVWWPRLEHELGAIANGPEPRPAALAHGEEQALAHNLARSQHGLSTPAVAPSPPHPHDTLDREPRISIDPDAIRDLKAGWLRVRTNLDQLDRDSGIARSIEQLNPPIDYLVRELDAPSR